MFKPFYYSVLVARVAISSTFFVLFYNYCRFYPHIFFEDYVSRHCLVVSTFDDVLVELIMSKCMFSWIALPVNYFMPFFLSKTLVEICFSSLI